MREATKKNLNLIIILLLAIILLLSSYLALKNKNTGKEIFSFLKGKGYSSNSPADSSNSDFYQKNQNTTIQTSSQGGGGGGSEGVSESSEPQCPLEQISYSMQNFNKISICNNNQSGICTDKTVTCSSEIHNWDYETTGLFEIELVFIQGVNKEDAFESKISGFLLGPRESKQFIDSTNILSSGIDGLANQEINCFFNTLTVPKKCS